MTITKNRIGDQLTVELQGRLNVSSATELREMLESELEGVTELIFDFKELEFISSAGIRVIAASQKRMNQQGSMKIRNANSVIIEIFKMTGLIDVFDIE